MGANPPNYTINVVNNSTAPVNDTIFQQPDDDDPPW